jgi:pimeloyl-ACP methyl ester carboxylesterase
VLRVLGAHVRDSRTAMIPDTSHWMFEQAPHKFCEIVLEFLGA